jgi:hypothetical protein
VEDQEKERKEDPKRKKGRKNRRRKKRKNREKNRGRQGGRNRPPPPTAAPLGTTAVSLHSSHRMLVPRLSLLPSSPSLLRLPLLSFACRT